MHNLILQILKTIFGQNIQVLIHIQYLGNGIIFKSFDYHLNSTSSHYMKVEITST